KIGARELQDEAILWHRRLGHVNFKNINKLVKSNLDVDDTISAEVHEGTAEVHEVEDEAGPSTFQDKSDEFIQDDILIANTLVNITRPRRGAGITIPGNIPEQERPES
ncbi:putative ribonuclease H-like domain-containing protein, partial [Tanacetum coccineum]